MPSQIASCKKKEKAQKKPTNFTPQKTLVEQQAKKNENWERTQLIFKHCFHMPRASEDKCVCMSHFCNLALKVVAIWVLLHHAVCSQLTHMLNMLKKKGSNMWRLPSSLKMLHTSLQRAYSQGIIRKPHPARQEWLKGTSISDPCKGIGGWWLNAVM